MRPEELQSAYAALRADYNARRISEYDLAKACADLMAQGDDGLWWGVDTAGRLLTFDVAQKAWVEAERRTAAPPPLPSAAKSRVTSAKAAAPGKSGPHANAAPAAPSASASASTTLAIVFGVSLALSYLGGTSSASCRKPSTR